MLEVEFYSLFSQHTTDSPAVKCERLYSDFRVATGKKTATGSMRKQGYISEGHYIKSTFPKCAFNLTFLNNTLISICTHRKWS